jgi:hypothetical protein
MTASTAAPALLRRRSPEDVAATARAILHAALHHLPAGLQERSVVVAQVARLDEALDEHGALERGDIHWEQPYPWLSAAEDPRAEALMMAACEAEDRARALLVTIAAVCGTEVADAIKAVAGEAS